MDLKTWLATNFPPIDTDSEPAEVVETNSWKDIRLFLSSTFIDTQAERDVIVKRVIPSLNRQIAKKFIRIVPVDLRWGVLAEQSKSCYAIQTTCLNQVDKCRITPDENPWFLGIRSQRYGWVQTELCDKERFDNPRKFEWINKLQSFGKHLSITSLECIHSSLPPKKRRESPTVFFYKRKITNYQDLEEDMRWVFDFEYVLPDAELEENVKYQYSKTPEAQVYRDDLDSLDNYLASACNVKYSAYSCTYEKGGAWYTSKNIGGKSFGVGYVSGLDEFEKMVEKDLLEAIATNFQDPGIPDDMPEFQVESIQHENAMRLKASTFVGRTDLFNTAYEHCVTDDAASSVMMLHGKPGCGKSGVLAAVAAHCLDVLRVKGDFFFIHGVDWCPGSTYLSNMLRRLQLALRHFRRGLGESDISKECKTSTNDLMSDFLVKTAAVHTDKMFVILVDAVNQFDRSMDAWTMWWLPAENSPKNIRVLLTTLDTENGTFANATHLLPTAIQVCVGPMSYKDREEMVSSVLAKYNKRLTTTDDPFLGNQMKNLLDKSTSPLYLTAAAEALRKFGIFEKVKEYIGGLPKEEIALLFGFLLDEWISEYGFEFTCFVTGVICLTKDGISENELNDIIFVKEKTDGPFNCSFSRMYDSIACFLSSGGGGFLRWFHDQLRYAVKEKFLTEEMEIKLHTCLVEFFVGSIQSQFSDTPPEPVASYYPHCLQRVVYHQTKLFRLYKDESIFLTSLRNIYFIRERAVYGQRRSLLAPVNHVKFPWRWLNNVNEEDVSGEKPLKYIGERLYSCGVAQELSSSASFSLMAKAELPTAFRRSCVCFGGDSSASVYQLHTGKLMRRVTLKGYVQSVYLSLQKDLLWTGTSKGSVTAWNIKSGLEEWSFNVSKSSFVIFLEKITPAGTDHPFANAVICGTGRRFEGTKIGEIALIHEDLKEVVKTWSTKRECLSYCYHAKQDIVASGHNGVIKLWNLSLGRLLKRIKVPGGSFKREIRDMSAHPKEDNIVFVVKTEDAGEVMRLNISNGECSALIPVSGYFICKYNQNGDRILCMNKNDATIEVHDISGNLLNKIVSHSATVYWLTTIPESTGIITAGRDGGMCSQIPSTPDDLTNGSADNVILACALIGPEYVTLSVDGQLHFRDVISHESRGSLRIPRGQGRRIAAHPNREYVLVATSQYLYLVNSFTIQIEKLHPTKNRELFIQDMKMSPSGMKCVFITQMHGASVYDVSDVYQIKESSFVERFEEKGELFSCDIYADNMQAVCGGRGMWLWNINTGQIITILKKFRSVQRSSAVKFVYHPNPVIVYHLRDYPSGIFDEVRIMTLKGVDVLKLECRLNTIDPVFYVRRSGEVVTAENDGSMRVYDGQNGNLLYIFVDHRSQGFNCFLESFDMITGFNANGTAYSFKT